MKRWDQNKLTNFIGGALTVMLVTVLACTTKPTPLPEVQAPMALSPSGSLSLIYSTYIGGGALDFARDVTTDSSGNIYVVGGTSSSDFHTTPGVYQENFNGTMDVFVMKFAPNGDLIWSTLIGGPNYERAYAVEVDSQGYVYVAGRAGEGYPTTPGVIQENFGGDSNPAPIYGPQDGFITKLTPDGADLVWSTFFGGNDRSIIRDMDIDTNGFIYLAMPNVSEPNPHITPGAFQSDLQGDKDGVVGKLSPNASSAVWVTYLGGSDTDLITPSVRAFDSSGDVFVAGGTQSSDIPQLNAYDDSFNGATDMYLARFSATGEFLFGTYLGGSGTDIPETHNLWLDKDSNPILSATTKSDNFPTTPGAYQTVYGGAGIPPGMDSVEGGDGFIAKISLDGSTLLASTYIGGWSGEVHEGISVDAEGNIFATGWTYSDDLPKTTDAFQGSFGGYMDAYVVKLSSDLQNLLYGSYLGGDNLDAARSSFTDPSGNLYMVGETKSTNWPLVNPIQPSLNGENDAVLAIFHDVPVTQTPTPTSTQPPNSTPTPTTTPPPGSAHYRINLPIAFGSRA